MVVWQQSLFGSVDVGEDISQGEVSSLVAGVS